MAMQAGHDMDKPVAAKIVKGVQKATITIDNGMSRWRIQVGAKLLF